MATEARVQLDMYPTESGGLRQPLRTPTPSLVFRPTSEVEEGGHVAGISLPDDAALVAGSTVTARVVFVFDESDQFIVPGRRFVLWCGRDVGTADILEVRRLPSADGRRTGLVRRFLRRARRSQAGP